MQKNTILAILLFGIGLTPSANAATKCVRFNSSTTCTADTGWTASCADTYTAGTFNCSSQILPVGGVADTSKPEGINRFVCYCQMLRPVVSKYISAGGMGSQAACMAGCEKKCSEMLSTNEKFRAGLFSNMQ